VAEWQTRTVQVRVSVRTWGFNSPLAHHPQVPVKLQFLSVCRHGTSVDKDH
jgi:hypothetical protein